MPLHDVHLIANDEDVHLATSTVTTTAASLASSKRRDSFEADAEVDSGFSKSNSPTDSSAPHGSVSGCSSMSEREISFEGYGEADHSTDNGTLASETEPNSLPLVIGSRANWMRNSLRRSDYNSSGDGSFHRRCGSLRAPGKRVSGSNALASQLFKSVNHNTSSRSSNGDNDDFCSDASLEDVVDLGHKVQFLQQQISALAGSPREYINDDQFNRTKQENAALKARLQMLEEIHRDLELRGQQQLTEEQRRNKELILRVEREKQLEIENCTIKLQGLEHALERTREEATQFRAQVERLRTERTQLQQRLNDVEARLGDIQDESRRQVELAERQRDAAVSEHAAVKATAAELHREVERLRLGAAAATRGAAAAAAANAAAAGAAAGHHAAHVSIARLQEMDAEIKFLKQDNNDLRETCDELQAQLFSRDLEKGRTLLNDHPATNSLAAEFEFMSQDDARTKLREQQEVNAQLRSYIEGILLNIVENQPSLLERKNP